MRGQGNPSRFQLIAITLAMLFVLPLAYFLSFGAMFSWCIRERPSTQTSNTVLNAYRPLFKWLPSRVMEEYVADCGVTDMEAFFFVQALKSDVPLDP